MLNQLKPSSVIVHGYMPSCIFDEYMQLVLFYRFPSEFELTHRGD